VTKFCVGDRVESMVNHPDGNKDIRIGTTGTVCRIAGSINVRWDHAVERGHDCGGHCERGYGWNVYDHEIKLYEEDDGVEIDENSFMSIIENAV